MKKIILFFIFAYTFINVLSGQTDTYSLRIQIVGFKSNEGNVLLQLYDNNNNTVAKRSKKISIKNSIIIIDNLKASIYSIRYFHDENSNNELDTNWLGIPSEGYGFSNNAIGTFGPPPIKERLFYVSDDLKIVLKIKY